MLQTLRYCSISSLFTPIIDTAFSFENLLVGLVVCSPFTISGTLYAISFGAVRHVGPALRHYPENVSTWMCPSIQSSHPHGDVYTYIYIYVCIYMSNIAQPNYSLWFWSLSTFLVFFSIQPLRLSQRWPRRAPRSRCSDSQLIPMMEVWNGTWWNRYPRTWDLMGLEWDKNIWVCLKLGYNCITPL
jgi:hypothetical protein